MVVTLLVCHFDRSPLNERLARNTTISKYKTKDTHDSFDVKNIFKDSISEYIVESIYYLKKKFMKNEDERFKKKRTVRKLKCFAKKEEIEPEKTKSDIAEPKKILFRE